MPQTGEHAKTVRAIEFYSGIGTFYIVHFLCMRAELLTWLGGLHIALDRSGVNGSVTRAYDWDQAACQVYQHNYGPIIKQVSPSS
jgi:hypothetical protein